VQELEIGSPVDDDASVVMIENKSDHDRFNGEFDIG